MVAIRGHFDGKVIVPDEPLNLAEGQRVIVHVQPVGMTSREPPIAGVKGEYLLGFAGTIPIEDLNEMARAVEEGCEKVDPNAW